MGPFPLESLLGKAGTYAVYLAIGVGFGAVLEMAGFGNARKLAAQFYFTEQTVLKVMFTAIVVAMVLVFGASSIGVLDYDALWVNPTYLWPGIVGGLVMGVGFVVGGFCPGTSLVAAATLKLDGIFFVLGALGGAFLFGETVGLYEHWWTSSYLGRLTLPDLLGLDTGEVVLLVVLMALFMFWGAEQLERRFGGLAAPSRPGRTVRLRLAGGLALTAAAVVLVAAGQPTPAEKWARVAPEVAARLAEGKVQILPAELLGLMHDDRLRPVVVDVRAEADYNVFHLRDALHLPLADVARRAATLKDPSDATVYVIVSNTGRDAVAAWKLLAASHVQNAYVLDGGLNAWLAAFAAHDADVTPRTDLPDDGADVLRYAFQTARGGRHPAARPDHTPAEMGLTFTPKVEIRTKAARKGGCG